MQKRRRNQTYLPSTTLLPQFQPLSNDHDLSFSPSSKQKIQDKMKLMQKKINYFEQYLKRREYYEQCLEEVQNELRALKEIGFADNISALHVDANIDADVDFDVSIDDFTIQERVTLMQKKIIHFDQYLKETRHYEQYFHEMKNDMIALQRLTSTDAISETSTDAILDVVSANIETADSRAQIIDNKDTAEKDKSNLYNTGGLHLHSILATCYFEISAMKSWMVAIGSFLLVSSQIFILLSIWLETWSRNDDTSIKETVACGVIGSRLMFLLFFMAILFICIVYEDIKESIIEEEILNHAISQRKDKISSLKAVELLRLCQRIRRFVLPWSLSQAAISLIYTGRFVSSNSIILNFLSIGFVAEADNFLGQFFFTESRSRMADKVVSDVIAHYSDEDNKGTNVSTSSFIWPRLLAIIPTKIVVIISIVLARMDICNTKMSFFNNILAGFLLPNIVLVIDSVKTFFTNKKQQESNSLFRRYMCCMGEWLLNATAFLVLNILHGLMNAWYSGGLIRVSILGGIPTLFITMCSHFYYLKFVKDEKEEKVCRTKGFGIYCFFLFVVYWALVIYIVIHFEESFFIH